MKRGVGIVQKNKKTLQKCKEKDGKVKCERCKQFKNKSEYYSNNQNKRGINSNCKQCDKIITKIFRDNNPEKTKEYKKRDYKKHRKEILKKQKQYTKDNKIEINRRNRIRNNKKRKNDPLFKIKQNISCLIRNQMMSHNFNKSQKSSLILKCSIEEFKKHIESQFLDWMNWSNYGNCKTNEYKCSWHLDHIIPVSIAKTEEDMISLNHWSNFQPLCSRENMFDKKDTFLPLSNTTYKKINKIIKECKRR